MIIVLPTCRTGHGRFHHLIDGHAFDLHFFAHQRLVHNLFALVDDLPDAHAARLHLVLLHIERLGDNRHDDTFFFTRPARVDDGFVTL
jgi:hypothetical protein